MPAAKRKKTGRIAKLRRHCGLSPPTGEESATMTTGVGQPRRKTTRGRRLRAEEALLLLPVESFQGASCACNSDDPACGRHARGTGRIYPKEHPPQVFFYYYSALSNSRSLWHPALYCFQRRLCERSNYWQPGYYPAAYSKKKRTRPEGVQTVYYLTVISLLESPSAHGGEKALPTANCFRLISKDY